MPHKVLYYTLDGSVGRAREILAERGAASAIELTGIAHEAFSSPTAGELAGMEAVVGEFMPVTGDEVEVMREAGVRLVASMSIGLDHVDVGGLARAGITVANCPGYCAPDVALHAVALMLDLMRKVTFANRAVRAGGWDPKAGYPMRRPRGLTCGLVFFGHIAREVAPLVRALGMDVVVWAPTKGAGELAAAGCERAGTLDELLGRSDVVSLHCPLVPETRDLIGRRELALMKPTAFLVNTARGELVDEEALADALESGEIQGAGLDTMRHEAHDRDRRLIGSDRCVITPHVGYDSVEAADNLRAMSLKSVVELLVEGVTPEYAVSASGRPEAAGPSRRAARTTR